MYTRKKQDNVTYGNSVNLQNVLKRHQNGLRLIKFERIASLTKTRGPIKIETLADVIIAWMTGERTVFVDTGEVHCVSNKTRSDLDLFLLCRHYFTMSYNEFEKQFKLLKNAKNKLPGHNNHSYNILGSGYCHTIGRRVYYHIQNVQDKNAIIEQFSSIKLKINKTSNIGETL